MLLGNLAGVPAVFSVQSKDDLTGKNSPTHGSHGTARNESGTLGNGLTAYERTLQNCSARKEQGQSPNNSHRSLRARAFAGARAALTLRPVDNN